MITVSQIFLNIDMWQHLIFKYMVKKILTTFLSQMFLIAVLQKKLFYGSFKYVYVCLSIFLHFLYTVNGLYFVRLQ